MRLLLKSFFSFSFLLVAYLVFASHAYADVQLTVDPKDGKAFQKTTFTASGCTPGQDVVFLWKNDSKKSGGYSSINKPYPVSDADSIASYVFPSGFDAGTYSADVNCNGADNFFPNAFTTTAINEADIKLSEETVGPELKNLVIEGCPPNGEILIKWGIVGPKVGDNEVKTADDTGKAKREFGPGEYIIDVACGGAVKENFSLTVDGESGDGFGGATYPTQPEPPAPFCSTMEDGKCIKTNTAIGEINTDGMDILYSIFVVILSLSGGILALTIMYAGYQIMASRGNPEQIQKGRELLTSAIIGFLFILFSYVILGVITTDVLRLPGFSTL